MKIFGFFAAFLAIASAESFKRESFELQIPENVEKFITKAKLISEAKRSSRIQNGNVVGSNTEWPFVVELTITMGENTFTCTGSIINLNFVLSARNCVM